jgi:hypothetical protein
MSVLYPRGSFSFLFNSINFSYQYEWQGKSESPNAIQVKNRRKTIGIEENLRVIMRREKCKRIFYICRNVRLAHSSVHSIRDDADKIKGSAKSGTKVFV